MARVDILKRLYSRDISSFDFQFDLLYPPGYILNYISYQDIVELNKIASSNKLADNPKLKYKYIDSIMSARGFRRLASGTNRVVYKYLEDQSFVIKVALDKVGLQDSLNEYKNQWYLKPYVTKCFEVTPCGTVGLFERVEPVTSRAEFASIAEDYYDMIATKIIGKYVLEDIGSNFFQNTGVRRYFGPVLLDYPYLFELDENKIYCNAPSIENPSVPCDGLIDYDLGFNVLICSKCGKRYLATELKTAADKNKIIIKGERKAMKISIVRGKGKETKVEKKFDNGNQSVSNFITPKETNPIKVSVFKEEESANDVVVNPQINMKELFNQTSNIRVSVVKDQVDSVDIKVEENKTEEKSKDDVAKKSQDKKASSSKIAKPAAKKTSTKTTNKKSTPKKEKEVETKEVEKDMLNKNVSVGDMPNVDDMYKNENISNTKEESKVAEDTKEKASDDFMTPPVQEEETSETEKVDEDSVNSEDDDFELIPRDNDKSDSEEEVNDLDKKILDEY